MNHFQIFKAGIPVTSMEGAVVSFSDAELAGIARRYDPTLHEAPIVVGHPKHDAPAYGWVRALSFADGALEAEEQQIDPEFDKLRQAGRYKKVSARFYTPTSKNNPTPGEYYLYDVGFLGGMPPAVKGLRSASFADGSEVVSAEVSFADLPAYAGTYIGSMFRGLRDFLIEKFGKDDADKVLPDWQVQSLNDMSVRADAQDSDLGEASFADKPGSKPASKEKPRMKTAEQLQAELDAATRERDAANTRAANLEKADRERAIADRHQDNVSFADTLVGSSRWPAGAKDVLVATLDHLATPADDKVVSFGEGDGAKPLHQVLREQLQQLPEQVSFGEFAGKGSGGAHDGDPSAIAARATAYQADQAKQGNQITTAQAVRHVSKG